ncbi:diaminopimelate decarboxylase [Phycisphaera mikurensis]|uniref:Diaminopimelate decarboxylase n=1 Tax=Phycisphaera mikurensis (strain NBRC 102666 / KCTC 22515 / FYK2301M01) TaxID=1142394 RepID=I0IGT1_PHYMF|nr:diaminopimelate decarboxylase [Phycisphaera mikurensis]MBB6443258.1 diaminopimelate decarboxylase [Phycisphaera mikurensis]BAM04469.1 diaminopimelate decarboxylase [Phycisphaera mikurensis NBRC 102666]
MPPALAESSTLPYSPVEVASRFGTPTYVYDAATLRARARSLTGRGATIRYAQKANNNTAVLALLRAEGVVVDAVTAGEIHRALAAGHEPADVVYTADVFDRDAVEALHRHGCPVNAGSPNMLAQLADAGLEHLPVTLRLNPGFGHGHSRKVNTGGTSSKHGIWHEQLEAVLTQATSLGLSRVRGLHMHIGSGSDFAHLHHVCDAMVAAAEAWKAAGGHELEVISAGGGLPIPYRKGEDEPLDLDRFFEAWTEARDRVCAIVGREVELEVEPGRYLAAEAGSLVAEVRGTKTQGEGDDAVDYLLIDAGFNDLLRPAMYGAYHHLEVFAADGRELTRERDYVVAGPLCESCDVFTQGDEGVVQSRRLPVPEPGDLLVIHDAGAYGAAMASRYNGRRLTAEAMVIDGELHEIRAREPIDEQLRYEHIPDQLQ